MPPTDMLANRAVECLDPADGLGIGVSRRFLGEHEPLHQRDVRRMAQRFGVDSRFDTSASPRDDH